MKDRYLVIADDLSGACETGVQLRSHGLSTDVIFSPAAPLDSSCVVNTESRLQSAAEAVVSVRSLCQEIDLASFKYVIKKVDSTLRGNIAAEVRAIDELYGSELVLFSPAWPALGRITSGGVHLLNEVPVSATELGRDTRQPVREDNLQLLLKASFAEPVTHLKLSVVRDPSALAAALKEGRVFSFDVAANEDLRAIVKSGLASGKKVLWVGTSALAEELFELECPTAPAFALVGSVNAITAEQVQCAKKAGIMPVPVPIYDLLEGRSTEDEFILNARHLLSEGNDTILLSAASFDANAYERTNQAGARLNMSFEDITRSTQGILGRMAVAVMKDIPVVGLFLTGGDTAMGFFKAANAVSITMLSEVMLRVPMLKINGGLFDGLPIVTKSGGFGREDSIVYAMRKLKERL